MRFLASTLAVLLVACPSVDEEPDRSNVCGDLSRAQVYRAALPPQESSGDLDVRLLSSDPAPPNTEGSLWTLALSDDNGGPEDACSCTASPFAPDHGQGTSSSTCTPGDSPQLLELEVDLVMPALWEVTIEVTCPQASAEVLFVFCAEG
ncbi:MAG: hypothetical protein KDA24_16990 [Deltaproteobacteria bacterium]|nr:hypothetical protein [Deltaproteobacteria bacterium]